MSKEIPHEADPKWVRLITFAGRNDCGTSYPQKVVLKRFFGWLAVAFVE
jgi:hypothetical protein